MADEQAEERVKAMKIRLDETNRHHQAASLAHQDQRVELERVTLKLQLAKETNMALAMEKMEWQDKIDQLELQLSGEGSFETEIKGKSLMAGSGATPIGGRGKIICAEKLLRLTNWLLLVQTLE